LQLLPALTVGGNMADPPHEIHARASTTNNIYTQPPNIGVLRTTAVRVGRGDIHPKDWNNPQESTASALRILRENATVIRRNPAAQRLLRDEPDVTVMFSVSFTNKRGTFREDSTVRTTGSNSMPTTALPAREHPSHGSTTFYAVFALVVWRPAGHSTLLLRHQVGCPTNIVAGIVKDKLLLLADAPNAELRMIGFAVAGGDIPVNHSGRWCLCMSMEHMMHVVCARPHTELHNLHNHAALVPLDMCQALCAVLSEATNNASREVAQLASATAHLQEAKLRVGQMREEAAALVVRHSKAWAAVQLKMQQVNAGTAVANDMGEICFELGSAQNDLRIKNEDIATQIDLVATTTVDLSTLHESFSQRMFAGDTDYASVFMPISGPTSRTTSAMALSLDEQPRPTSAMSLDEQSYSSLVSILNEGVGQGSNIGPPPVHHIIFSQQMSMVPTNEGETGQQSGIRPGSSLDTSPVPAYRDNSQASLRHIDVPYANDQVLGPPHIGSLTNRLHDHDEQIARAAQLQEPGMVQGFEGESPPPPPLSPSPSSSSSSSSSSSAGKRKRSYGDSYKFSTSLTSSDDDSGTESEEEEEWLPESEGDSEHLRRRLANKQSLINPSKKSRKGKN